MADKTRDVTPAQESSPFKVGWLGDVAIYVIPDDTKHQHPAGSHPEVSIALKAVGEDGEHLPNESLPLMGLTANGADALEAFFTTHIDALVKEFLSEAKSGFWVSQPYLTGQDGGLLIEFILNGIP